MNLTNSLKIVKGERFTQSEEKPECENYICKVINQTGIGGKNVHV